MTKSGVGNVRGDHVLGRSQQLAEVHVDAFIQSCLDLDCRHVRAACMIVPSVLSGSYLSGSWRHDGWCCQSDIVRVGMWGPHAESPARYPFVIAARRRSDCWRLRCRSQCRHSKSQSSARGILRVDQIGHQTTCDLPQKTARFAIASRYSPGQRLPDLFGLRNNPVASRR